MSFFGSNNIFLKAIGSSWRALFFSIEILQGLELLEEAWDLLEILEVLFEGQVDDFEDDVSLGYC